MKLRRAVFIAVLSATLLIIVLFAHLTHSRNASRTIDETSRLSNAITTSVAELDQLVYQFFLHPHPRPMQQWRLLSADMEMLFVALEEVAGTQSSVTRLRSDHLQARELFDALVAEVNDGTVGISVIHQRRNRLAEQMLLVSRSLVNQAEVVHRESLREQSRIQSRDGTITFAALCAIIVLLVWLLAYVQRYVLTRLQQLRNGAERAAQGHFEQSLDDSRQDEIGELSRTFDRLLREVRNSRDRISNEAGLRASEERQRQIIDALPGLVWAAQPDGTIDTSNRSWREQFEVTPNAPGYDWTDLMHPNDRPSWQAAWRNALTKGTAFEIEFRLQNKGIWRWYLTRVAPLTDELGKLLRWVCKASDIHHHKELEIHLRNSRNQAELLNQVGLDLVGELDVQRLTQRVTDTARALVDAEIAVLNYEIVDADTSDSQRCYAVSGIPTEVFDGFGAPQLTELFRPTTVGLVVRCDDVRLDKRFIHQVPDQSALPDQPLVVSYLAVPVRTRYGTILGGLFCTHSQPAQFTAQHERLLHGIAALAATAFDSARLIEAERRQRRLADQRTTQLARSNAELEQFAYICSHDLQEPLRMVSTFLGLLDDRYRDRLDERAHGFIRRAIDGSTRMQGMIREILDFSRVGRGERAEESFHMADIVQVAITNLQAAIEQSGAQIQLGELPKVRANRLQCVQLMQNLIGNALKYHSDKTLIVRISSVAENSRWRISVSDNGIGIDPVHHQRIFQVFQRLHGREQFEGNGIGLSLCQKIVLAHGGTIGVESQLGQGATFWFTLPDALVNTDPTPTSGMYPLLDVDADAEK